MRSGLQKPGAIPFLALLIFSLISLVPSLAKEWDLYNLQLGYIGYSRGEVRQASRVKDSWADVRSRLRVPGGPWKPWLLDGYYQTYYDRPARPRRCAVDAPSRSTFEAATVFDTESLFPARESSAFTRGVRAFKAMVVKRSESPVLQSLPAEGHAVEKSPTRLPPPLINSSLTPEPPSDGILPEVPPSSSRTIPPPSSIVETSRWLMTFSRASWQQVCRAGGEYWDNVSVWSGASPSSSRPDNGSSHVEIPRRDIPREQRVSPKALAANSTDMSLVPHAMATAVPSQNTTGTAAGQSKVAGFQQESEPMRRGSCMAIVIGLVVGVMWF
ncbi:hypothetical protein BO70DRAFT_127413 [Aspergillus heteromorphus CBS 117.55]|uniref:Uncharacterized protein n=1 Tax=Aspergillus heteromorphus CBS 117.55 TaxID=1448321 RepID=A0A317WTS6_9EURO|nr:uncharacterized protein BO70DRAFT_127413 [Aspergillus heteromorphus CBS 117.55]PWY89746.1 hypothetical protein BO70DRAFT_127413 [Aspergillus heteromorphus CBS 117.55]